MGPRPKPHRSHSTYRRLREVAFREDDFPALVAPFIGVREVLAPKLRYGMKRSSIALKEFTFAAAGENSTERAVPFT